MKSSSSGILSLLELAAVPSFADVTVDLGAAAPFALLAVKGVNNTGSTFINGSVGTTGRDLMGFPPGIITGAVEVQNDAASTAHADFVTARSALLAVPATQQFGEFDLVEEGQVFNPGVFMFLKELQIQGDITLSGAGQFIFQSGSHLNISNDVTVALADGAVASNVFFVPGDATLIGNNSVLNGMVLTEDRVALSSGAVVNGHIYAFSGIAMENSTVGLL